MFSHIQINTVCLCNHKHIDPQSISVFVKSCCRLLQLGRRRSSLVVPVLISAASLSHSVYASTETKKSHSTIGNWVRLLCSTADVHCNNAEDVVQYLKSSRVEKVVVMTGAGISTASGIPDFRTPGTGLYDNIQKYNLPYPEAIFDINYFTYDQKPFFALAKELYPSGNYKPNVVHYFIKLLNDKGLLLRNYTQNIDGLEKLAGVPDEKLVEAHGSFSTATCRVCYKSYIGEEIKDSIMKGEIPRCKRSLCNGVIKPDIVFFGENLPAKFFSFTIDMPQADLLIVMGTSLEVFPFAGIAEATLPGVPRILFNKEACGPFVSNPRSNDVIVEGDLVKEVLKFCESLGWREELDNLINSSEAEAKQKH